MPGRCRVLLQRGLGATDCKLRRVIRERRFWWPWGGDGFPNARAPQSSRVYLASPGYFPALRNPSTGGPGSIDARNGRLAVLGGNAQREIGDGRFQAFFEADFWFPAERSRRLANDRLASLRVVLRQRSVVELGRRMRLRDDLPC